MTAFQNTLLFLVVAAFVACGGGSDSNDPDGIQDVIESDVPSSVDSEYPLDVVDTPDGTDPLDTINDPDVPEMECEDLDGDGYGPGCLAGPDCAPEDPFRYRLVSLYQDHDYDGYGSGDPKELCIGAAIPIGWATVGGDCNDSNPMIFPGAPEFADDNIPNACAGADLKAASAEGVFVVPGAPDTGTGTREDPVGRLSTAVSIAKAKGLRDIFMAEGSYFDQVMIEHDVTIHGSYDPSDWKSADGDSLLYATGAIAIRTNNANVAMTRMSILGIEQKSGLTYPITGGVLAENGSLTMFDCYVDGGYFDLLSESSGMLAQNFGLKIANADVTLLLSDVHSGECIVEGGDLEGEIEFTVQTNAIIMESGRLRANQTTMETYGEVSLGYIFGTAIAHAKTRGLTIESGEVSLISTKTTVGSATEIIATDASQGQASASATVDAVGIEVNGNATLSMLNCQEHIGWLDIFAEVYITDTEPADGSYKTHLRYTGLQVIDGTADILHSAFTTDPSGEAKGSIHVPNGEAKEQNQVTLRSLEIEDKGKVRLLNSVLINIEDYDDSAILYIQDNSRLRILNSLLWDEDYGTCVLRKQNNCGATNLAELQSILDAIPDSNSAGILLTNPKVDEGWVLTPQSPLINAGIDPAEETLAAYTDVKGNPRPAGPTWDIGIYEKQQ